MKKLSVSLQIKIELVLLVVLINPLFFGAQNLILHESFLNLKNDTIKREIAFFNKKNIDKKAIIEPIKLNKYIPKICCDSFVYFDKGNILMMDFSINFRLNKALDTTQKLCYDTNSTNSSISIKYNPGPHNTWTIPEKFFLGLFHPKSKTVMVYRSLDRRRMYVYTILQNQSSRYEVIWVILGYNNYIRVIDKIE